MASRMMHYAVAKRIAKELNLEDENAFCLGAVIVDCYKAQKESPKNISHFLENYGDSRTCNFKRFSEKYLREETDDFSLGYFLHLLMDSINLKDIIGNTIYQYNLADRPEANRKFVDDMHIYNAVLKQQYNLEYDLTPLNTWRVDEIRIGDQEEFLKEFKADFDDDRIDDFKVLTQELLDNFMRKSFELGIRNIKLILNQQECDDPRQFALADHIR